MTVCFPSSTSPYNLRPPVRIGTRTPVSYIRNLTSRHVLHSAPALIFTRIGVSYSSPAQLAHKNRRGAVVMAAEAEATSDQLQRSSGTTAEDAAHMRRAVELARQALGKTSPNPMVGCVIVKDGVVVGEGFHPKAGEPHAEVFALRQAGSQAVGATAYVSLEPCNHYGRTPPCSQALVKAKVAKVVVGTLDPNPQVGGKGIQTLRKAGIEVVVGVEEELCARNVEAFFCRIKNQRPMATLRYAMSLDGKLLGDAGTDSSSGSHYSRLLAETDVVIVSAITLARDPTFLSEEADVKQPLRLVLARTLDMPRTAKVFDTSGGPTLVVTDETALREDMERCGLSGEPLAERWLSERGVEVVITDSINFDNILDLCYQRGVCSVLWDAQGPELLALDSDLGQSVVAEQVFDKVVLAIAPVFVGKDGARAGFVSDEGVQKLERVRSSMCGEHVIVEGYLVK